MAEIEGTLKLFDKLGINPLYVLVVVFGTMILKSFDPKNRFKQGYVLFPLFTGLIVCLLDKPFVVTPWLFRSAVHAAIGSYSYQLYVKLIRDRKRETK